MQKLTSFANTFANMTPYLFDMIILFFSAPSYVTAFHHPKTQSYTIG